MFLLFVVLRINSFQVARCFHYSRITMNALNINEHHKSVLHGYCELNRYQRQQYVRSVESAISDVIESKLLEDTYTRDEITEILTNIRCVVVDELEAELINVIQSNILMLCQLFEQAEKWHLQLTIDLSEMQNKELLEKLKDIECTPLKLEKLRLTPLSTDIQKTSEVLRLEILSLQGENKQLLEDIKDLQKKILDTQRENENLNLKSDEKDKLIAELKQTVEKVATSDAMISTVELKHPETEKILEDYDSVLKEQISRELEDMKKKVEEAQSQLTLAEMELEKKFNSTAAYNNMKKIISKKNEQIKDLRNRLSKYESDMILENGIEDKEELGQIAQ